MCLCAFFVAPPASSVRFPFPCLARCFIIAADLSELKLGCRWCRLTMTILLRCGPGPPAPSVLVVTQQIRPNFVNCVGLYQTLSLSLSPNSVRFILLLPFVFLYHFFCFFFRSPAADPLAKENMKGQHPKHRHVHYFTWTKTNSAPAMALQQPHGARCCSVVPPGTDLCRHFRVSLYLFLFFTFGFFLLQQREIVWMILGSSCHNCCVLNIAPKQPAVV